MSTIFPKQTYIGLTIDFLNDGTRLISYVSLVKKNKGLIIVESKTGLNDFNSLADFFKNNPSVFLVITGKGIIHKKVEAESIKEDLQQANLVPYVLPNVDTKEFYGQQHDQGGSIFISVCRNKLIEDQLKELSVYNCYPSEILLGPFAIETIAGFIDSNIEINVNFQRLIFLDGKINTIESLENYKNESYVIEGESVSSEIIIAYSAAILNSLDKSQSYNKTREIEDNRNTIRFRAKFKKYLAISLGIFCFLLLINFLVFSYLFQKAEAGSSMVSSNEEYVRKQNKIRSDYQKRKEFILRKNWDNKVHLANYMEDLSSAAPSGLTLTNVTYQKLDSKKSRLEKTMVFDYSSIEINGTVRNSGELNQCMKKIDEFSYVKDIKLLDYKKSVSSNTYIFNLKILLND